MLLQDDTGITAFALSPPESRADWSVELEVDWGSSPYALTTRLLNRGLSNFNVKGGTNFAQTNEEALPKMLAEIETNLMSRQKHG
jgi:hypothetical protein